MSPTLWLNIRGLDVKTGLSLKDLLKARIPSFSDFFKTPKLGRVAKEAAAIVFANTQKATQATIKATQATIKATVATAHAVHGLGHAVH